MPNLRTDAVALATIAGSALLGGVVTFGSMAYLESSRIHDGEVWTVSHDVGPRIEIHSGDVSRAIIVRDLRERRHEVRRERRERRRHRHRHRHDVRGFDFDFDFDMPDIREQARRSADDLAEIEMSQARAEMARQRAWIALERAKTELRRQR